MTAREFLFGAGVFLAGWGIMIWAESRISLSYLELREAGYKSTLLGIKKINR